MRAWLVAAALLAVLLGATGCGLREGSPDHPGAAVPVPLSVIRQGNEITLTGDVPDPAAKRALVDAVITSADDVTVVDRLGVRPGAATPDFAASAPVFEAAAVIGDFALHAAGDSVTLVGTAAKQDEAAAVEAAARDAWPRTDIVNELVISGPGAR
ncbi:MAG: BON domain-containing protein [Actinomycetota bacterium]|nr:BON domain-containing protein [Actinomycetota bacterium]